MPYSISSEQVTEGQDFIITVSRDNTDTSESFSWQTIFYSTTSNWANIAATEDDFTGALSGTASFAVGESTTTFTLSTVDDTILESSHRFMVGITESSGSSQSITLAILDNENTDVELSVNTTTEPFYIGGSFRPTFLVDIEAGQSYIASIDAANNSRYSSPSFSVEDNWGNMLDSFTGEDMLYSFTAETSGQYQFKTDIFLGSGGYHTFSITTDNEKNAQNHLDGLGISMQDAKTFVLSFLDQPSFIYQTAQQHNITSAMLAGIVDVSLDDVNNFFSANGLDPLAL